MDFPVSVLYNLLPILLLLDESLKLAWAMIKEDIHNVPLSPLHVNINEMSVINLPLLELHNFNVLPTKMNLKNNGRTGKLSYLYNKKRNLTASLQTLRRGRGYIFSIDLKIQEL